MTIYELKKIPYDATKGSMKINDMLDSSGYISYSKLEGKYFIFEDNAASLRGNASAFLNTAIYGSHVHLSGRNTMDSRSKMDLDVEILIEDSEYPPLGGGPPRLTSFRYEAKSLASSVLRPLRPGSRCLTGFDEDDKEFAFVGNMDALLSLAEHCLDLAEDGSPPGVELIYEPGVQLIPESIPFKFRKI